MARSARKISRRPPFLRRVPRSGGSAHQPVSLNDPPRRNHVYAVGTPRRRSACARLPQRPDVDNRRRGGRGLAACHSQQPMGRTTSTSLRPHEPTASFSGTPTTTPGKSSPIPRRLHLDLRAGDSKAAGISSAASVKSTDAKKEPMRAAYYERKGRVESLVLGGCPTRSPRRANCASSWNFSGINPTDNQIASRLGRQHGKCRSARDSASGRRRRRRRSRAGRAASRIGVRVWILRSAARPRFRNRGRIRRDPFAGIAVALPRARAFETGACLGIAG